MNSNEYLEIREAVKLLYHKIMEWGEDKFNLEHALKTLNFSRSGIKQITHESEDDNLTEYLIYVSKHKGKRVLDLFYDSDVELNEKEEILLEAMIDSQMHILEITGLDPNPNRHRVFLKDLITSVPYEIINVGISQSGKIG